VCPGVAGATAIADPARVAVGAFVGCHVIATALVTDEIGLTLGGGGEVLFVTVVVGESVGPIVGVPGTVATTATVGDSDSDDDDDGDDDGGVIEVAVAGKLAGVLLFLLTLKTFQVG
jgi:hypothetical protein